MRERRWQDDLVGAAGDRQQALGEDLAMRPPAGPGWARSGRPGGFWWLEREAAPAGSDRAPQVRARLDAMIEHWKRRIAWAEAYRQRLIPPGAGAGAGAGDGGGEGAGDSGGKPPEVAG